MSKRKKVNRLVRIYAERELAKQIKQEAINAALTRRREIHSKVQEYKENNSPVKFLTSLPNLYQTNKG